MAIHLLLIGGGAALTGAISYFRGRKDKHNEVIESKPLIEQYRLEMLQRKENTNRNLQISTLATGITGAAQLVAPPLLLIGVPLTIYSSLPIFADTWKGLSEEKKFRSTVLDSIAIGGALLAHYYFMTSLVNMIYFIGQKILVQTEDISSQQLVDIFNSHPRSVWLWIDWTEVEVPYEKVEPGHLIIVHAGETIPFDGEVEDGFATVDQHMLTGESQLQDKTAGDKVFAATLLIGGKLFIRVEKAGSETMAAQIGDILQNTKDFKSSVEAKGVEIANSLTLPTLGLSGIALLTLGPLGAVSVTNCSYTETVRITIPLSVLNHLKTAAENGILIKDGRALELLTEVDTVVFDKTGTLTQEMPNVGRIHSCGDYSEDEILSMAATAEHRQKHPVALAIKTAAEERRLRLAEIDHAHYEIGYGIKVRMGDRRIHVGSRQFMVQEGVAIPESELQWTAASHEQGHGQVYLSIDHKLEGIIELHAVIRPEIPAIVKKLRERGLHLCIISGDHRLPTERLANSLGIEEFFAETLPEDKAKQIESLQAQGRKVCFIGDGINDAIAMKKAQVAISLKGATTIATDTASIVFVDQSLAKLDDLFDLASSIDNRIKSGLNMSFVSGAIGVAGVFFIHMRIVGSLSLYVLNLVASVGHAMLPIPKESKHTHEPTNKKAPEPGQSIAQTARDFDVIRNTLQTTDRN